MDHRHNPVFVQLCIICTVGTSYCCGEALGL
jgi:hypothetical protein